MPKNIIWCYLCINSDTLLIHGTWRVHEKRILVPEMNKINVMKELLNVKHNSASVSVLDLADIVFFVY